MASKWPRRAKIGQSHSGRRFCLRGAYAELPREIASQIPMSGLPGTDPFGAMSGSSWCHLIILGPSEGPLGGHEAAKIQLRLCRQIVPSAWCQVREYPVPSARCPLPGRPQDLCAIGACTCLMHLLPSLRWAFRQPSAELMRAGFFFFRVCTYFLSL